LGLPIQLLFFAHYFSPINLASTIIAGVAVGAIVGLTPLYKELKRLDKQGSSNIKRSTAVVSALLIVDVCLILGVLVAQGGINLNQVQLTVILFSGISALTSMAGKPLLFAAWRRKNKSEIWQGHKLQIFSTPTPNTALGSNFQQPQRGLKA
jgi:hypothetical protein